MKTGVISISGALLGLALGDAWGYPTEFKKFEELFKEKPDFPENGLISDDTQMSIATLRAIQKLEKAKFKFDDTPTNEWVTTVRKAFLDEYVIWLTDPRNNRAPGNTCLTALKTYRNSSKETGLEGTQWNSMGCGSNMRAPWLGLLPYNPETIARLAQIQAEVTHGHEQAGPPAVLTALTVWNILNAPGFKDAPAEDLLDWASDTCKEFADTDFWEWRGEGPSGERLSLDSVSGFREFGAFLTAIKNDYAEFVEKPEIDINKFFGEGWIAPEAFANGFAAFLAYRDEPVEGLKRLVYSNGDSDSIGAIGGAFLGAYTETWPTNLSEKIEADYLEEIRGLEKWLVELNKKHRTNWTKVNRKIVIKALHENETTKQKVIRHWPHAGATAFSLVAAIFVGLGVAQLMEPEYVPPEIQKLIDQGIDPDDVTTVIPDEGEPLPRDEDAPPIEISLGRWGGTREVDSCDGKFIGLSEYRRMEGLQDTYAAHNRCNGDQILYLGRGDTLFIDGVEYRVTDLRDLRKRNSKISELVGIEGEIILQSCFYNSLWMRFVGVEKVETNTTTETLTT